MFNTNPSGKTNNVILMEELMKGLRRPVILIKGLERPVMDSS